MTMLSGLLLLAAQAVAMDGSNGLSPGDPGQAGGAWEDDSGFDLPDFGLPLLEIGPSAIVAGQLSNERPNVVALAGIDLGSGRAQVFCTGTVVQRTWVLTAAHCLTGARQMERQGMSLHVAWGYDILNDGYTHAIPWLTAIPHPAYRDGVFANDIGLIELAEAVPKDVPLTVLNDDPVDDGWIGQELLFVGFGLTRARGGDSGIMREARIPVDGYDDQHIYAYSPTSNLCQGDSGGPSFREVDGHLEQTGVNSFVSGGCVGGSSGSANVERFLPWLLEHVPDLLFEPQFYAPGHPFDVGVDGPMHGPGIGLRFGPRRGPGALPSGCHTLGWSGSLSLGAWGLVLGGVLMRRRRG